MGAVLLVVILAHQCWLGARYYIFFQDQHKRGSISLDWSNVLSIVLPTLAIIKGRFEEFGHAARQAARLPHRGTQTQATNNAGLVFLELLPQLMVLPQPDVSSTHPEASCKHVVSEFTQAWLHIINTHSMMSHNAVSCWIGSASSPVYITCINAMIPSRDLALLRFTWLVLSLLSCFSTSVKGGYNPDAIIQREPDSSL